MRSGTWMGKLKPFGVAISGCIDGFSRDIVWMKAYTTNNDPKVTADYFVSSLGWMPGATALTGGLSGTDFILMLTLFSKCRDLFRHDISTLLLRFKSTFQH